MLRIYITDVSNLIDSDGDSELWTGIKAVLCKERLKRHEALKNNPKGRALNAGAGALLTYVLCKPNVPKTADGILTELTPTELMSTKNSCEISLTLQTEIIVNAHGKPEFPADRGLPHFNISHSGTKAVLAVSDKEVGIDIQEIRPVRGAKVSDRFFTEKEKRLAGSDTNAFYGLWTRKEAYGKCLGTGLMPVMDTDVSGPAPEGFEIMDFELPDYRISVCLKK